jgi:hypothetical protein
LRGDDPAIPEEKCTRHLQAVTGQMADPAALEDGDGPTPPDTRSEEFEKAAFSQTECPIEFAAGIRDSRHPASLAEVSGFPAVLKHVDEDQP